MRERLSDYYLDLLIIKGNKTDEKAKQFNFSSTYSNHFTVTRTSRAKQPNFSSARISAILL
jgi:hypothetical protein